MADGTAAPALTATDGASGLAWRRASFDRRSDVRRRRLCGAGGGGPRVSGPDTDRDYGHGGGAEIHGEEAGGAKRQGRRWKAGLWLMLERMSSA